jgi:hypothetical protein
VGFVILEGIRDSLERLTLRMYGFVGWNDLGTMVVREMMSSKVA